MVVIAKKFLRSVVSLTGARRKFSSHEIALASSFIKYTTVNLSNNSNQICLPRCLSTVSYESTDSQSNANTLREDLKKSRDRVAELVHAVPDKENLIDELTNLLSEIVEEKINAQEKQIKSLQEDLVVLAKKFLRPMVSFTGARRKFSSQKTALAWGSFKYVNALNLPSNSNKLFLCRYLSTVSNENTDVGANPLREDLKKTPDWVASLVHSVEALASLLRERNNELLRCKEKIDAQEKQIKSLQDDVATAEAKYYMEERLAEVRLTIKRFEENCRVTDYDPSYDERQIIREIPDKKERKIKTDEFKWLFLLSPRNPHFHVNAPWLLLKFEEKKISLEKACRSIAVINQHFAREWQWYQDDEYCFNPADYDIVVEDVKAHRDVLECFHPFYDE